MSKNLFLQYLENDIAMLELAEEVDVSVYTPARLPKSGENFVGKTAMATGILDRHLTLV